MITIMNSSINACFSTSFPPGVWRMGSFGSFITVLNLLTRRYFQHFQTQNRPLHNQLLLCGSKTWRRTNIFKADTMQGLRTTSCFRRNLLFSAFLLNRCSVMQSNETTINLLCWFPQAPSGIALILYSLSFLNHWIVVQIERVVTF